MTITREQVFSCAYELSYTAQYPFTGHYDAVNNAASLLRDLWQRVEQSEARIVELEAACEGAMDHRTFGSQGADVIRKAMEKRGWGGS